MDDRQDVIAHDSAGTAGEKKIRKRATSSVEKAWTVSLREFWFRGLSSSGKARLIAK
jgi:hypothetical protein